MEAANDFFTRAAGEFIIAGKEQKADYFRKAEKMFIQLEGKLRERLQKDTREMMLKVIDKLAKGETISGGERGLVRLWIVGDAEAYVRMENNFDDWVKELVRIADEISKEDLRFSDPQTLFRLRGMLSDGQRVLDSVIKFLQQKERAENFDRASQNLGQKEREHLVRILKEQVKSPGL